MQGKRYRLCLVNFPLLLEHVLQAMKPRKLQVTGGNSQGQLMWLYWVAKGNTISPSFHKVFTGAFLALTLPPDANWHFVQGSELLLQSAFIFRWQTYAF